MNDKAIEYEALLHQAKKIIKNLKSLKIEVTTYKKRLDKIENECKKDVESSINNEALKEASYGAEAFLIMDYTNAISDLKDLIADLSKYEIYLRIASFAGVLRDFINSNKKDPIKLSEMRESLINHLNALKLSSTRPYDNEEQLVKDLYKLTFEFIKEEIIVNGASETLNLLKDDMTHSWHLDKYISRRLDELNLKDKKYEKVASIKREIDLDGVTATYLNEKLIKALIEVDNKTIACDEVVSFTPTKTKDERVAELTKLIDNYLWQMKQISHAKTYPEKVIIKEKKTRNKHIRKLLLRIPALLLTSSITLGLVAGAGFLAKKVTTTKKYKGTKTTYSEETGNTINETLYVDYGEVKIIEISPYQRALDGSYFREKTYYDASSYGDMPISFFLNLDVSNLSKGYTIKETKDNLSSEELYNETLRSIEKTVIDLNNSKEQTDWVFFIPLLGLLEVSAVCFWILIGCIYGQFTDKYMVLDQAKEILNIINDLKHSEKTVKEAEKELKRLIELANQLFIENKDSVEELLKLIPLIENDPNYQKEVIDAKVVLQRVKQDEKGITR